MATNDWSEISMDPPNKEQERAEEEFREALIKYMKSCDNFSEDNMLLHFEVITISIPSGMTDARAVERIAHQSSLDFPFVYQLGALEYCGAWLRNQAGQSDD